MPLYDYRCVNQECNHEFEEHVNLSELDKEIKCPECGEEAKKLVTAKVPIHSTWKHWRL